MHRDIKPENILLEKGKGYDALKLVDFGSSHIYRDGERVKALVGTPYYIAPEVLAKNYTEKCDLWSIGAIAYILLSGFPPFGGDTDEEIMENIRKGTFDFDLEQFAETSDAAKDFIR